MSESYENLVGATGNERFFRPQRYEAVPLFRGTPPTLWFRDNELSLQDISANGAAAKRGMLQSDESLGDNESGVLRLTQGGRELFRANARTARKSLDKGVLLLGLALENDTFDLEALTKDNAKAYILDAANKTPPQKVPTHYKEFCADVHSFTGQYLERLISQFGTTEEKFTRSDKQEIFQQLYDEIKRPWADMLYQGNELVIPHHHNREMRKSLKRYTELVITRDFVKGPTWWRSYFKPLGYPGDYYLMNYMYDERPEGETLEEMFLHSLGLVAGRPIVSRMHTLSEILLAKSNAQGAEPLHITSIGCGPAREFETVFTRAAPGSKWNVTLLDQEPKALEFALTSFRSASARNGSFVASALNTSFTDMLSPNRGMIGLPQQDVIYSLGLVDYLSLPLAVKFTKRMYEMLRPGGKVIIANINNKPTGITWQAEHITDWTLYFRSKEEMLAMAQGVPEAKVEIAQDAINSVYFLIVSKPGN